MVTVNGTPVEFRQEMMLSHALAEACIDTDAPILITVNDVLVDKCNIGRHILFDNAEIRAMPILSGG